MMALLSFFAMNMTNPQNWIIPTAGAVSTGMALYFGYAVLGRRRQARASGPPSSRRGQDDAPTRDPFVFGSAAERRVALRRRGNPKEIMVSDAEVKEAPFQAWVVDRSTGGLCLSLGEEIPVGKVLSVRALNAPDTIPWVQIEVRSCRHEDDGWEAGCQFLKTPSWSVMLLFG
jgi:hypothetical protein